MDEQISCAHSWAPATSLLAGWCVLAILTAGALRAQDRPPRASRALMEMRAAASGSADELRRPASGVYDVIALRVEFQPDTSRFTTGTGLFQNDLYGGLEPAVDPLPHDAAYFDAHLQFLESYVAQVSDGAVQVRTHLVPEVVRVPNQMGSYAPTGENSSADTELAKLARLVRDAWTAANTQVRFDMGGFDPARTAFAIFHAGVGRDIELIGTSLDKTPQDLPSLFFGQDALDRLGVNGVTFQGFPVTHSMILPRTETRLGTDFIADEPYLFELSINGLLAASFFNYLGVPDLFDTQTGESAIGPFGLMDGQGIFAYRGLFPPEPMAWTKYYLGWTDPIVLDDYTSRTVTLDAVSAASGSPSARAVISDAEYFLIENRYRDPGYDGLTLQIYQDGSVVEQHVENGDEAFNSLTVDGFIGGVVIAADGYDWALPGGLDEDGNELNGGILIWHVDERRLRSGLGENAVNVGPETRAIDLEEADGAQDIGHPSGPIGPQPELGSPFDYFYEGNPVRVAPEFGSEIRLYENRFGPSTHPSSETNAGGPSFIVIEEFSAPAAQMTFQYRRQVVAGIEPAPIEGAETLRQVIEAEGLLFDVTGSVSMTGAFPVFYSGSAGKAVIPTSGGTFTIASAADPVATEDERLIALREGEEGGLWLAEYDIGQDAEETWAVPLPEATAGMQPRSPLVRIDDGEREQFYLVLGGSGDAVVVEGSAEGTSLVPTNVGEPLRVVAAASGGRTRPLVVGRNGAGFPGEPPAWTFELPENGAVGSPVFAGHHGELIGAVPLPGTGELLLLNAEGDVQVMDVSSVARRVGTEGSAVLSSHPALVDVDDDGQLDVMIGYGPVLLAFSRSGAVAEGFPIEVGARVRSQPILARFTGQERWTILVAAADGYLYGIDARGRTIDGFPLEVGDSAPATPALAGNRLIAVSRSGSVKQWTLPAVDTAMWNELHGPGNAAFVAGPDDAGQQPPIPGASLIDREATYNWPNPITDGFTHLRVRTGRDARVGVEVIDAAGSVVDELEFGSVTAGVPSEIVWQADVESGLYFAKITATTGQGERETSVIKMAVIR